MTKKSSQPTVFLGMSGGVDSSVSALLLKQQGYQVVGVYMKNWSKDLPGMHCPWAEDLADAKRVATKLGLDFQVFNFESDYKKSVVDYMLAEFQAGRTPNPDIMCNQHIKFKLFFHTAISQGADFIATGHYARTQSGQLLTALDSNKDQTYFLYRVPKTALHQTLFPLGQLRKSAVKQLAADHGLHNAYKKESMGVCFVGDVGINDFLSEYLEPFPGPILDYDTKAPLGTHQGLMFYTVGQRHGLSLDNHLPLYVVDKDTTANTLYVSANLNHPLLWVTQLTLKQTFFRSLPSAQKSSPQPLTVRLRHRGPLLPVQLQGESLVFDQPVKRPAPGQSAVLYQGEVCLGGGIIV